MSLGRRQLVMLRTIAVHGWNVPVVRTRKDHEVYRSLERKGLVRMHPDHFRLVGDHVNEFDATELTAAGRRALRESAYSGAPTSSQKESR